MSRCRLTRSWRSVLVLGLLWLATVGCHVFRAAQHRAEKRTATEFSCGEGYPPSAKP